MLAALVIAGVGSGAASVARADTVVPQPVPKLGPLAPALILPLIFEVDALDGSESTSQQGSSTTVRLSTDVLFAFGSADLSGRASAQIDDAAAKLRGVTGRVSVTGYTDSVGSDAVNIPLSLRRAQAVVAALAPKVHGVVTLLAAGRGSADPVAPNTVDGTDNPAGRAKNRRVEIVFTG